MGCCCSVNGDRMVWNTVTEYLNVIVVLMLMTSGHSGTSLSPMWDESTIANTGCEFGDKVNCSFVTGRDCYHYEDVCCETCTRFTTDIPGCKYGDKWTDCNPQMCSNFRSQCCETCYQPNTTISTATTIPTTTTLPASYITAPTTIRAITTTAILPTNTITDLPTTSLHSTTATAVPISNNSIPRKTTTIRGQEITASDFTTAESVDEYTTGMSTGKTSTTESGVQVTSMSDEELTSMFDSTELTSLDTTDVQQITTNIQQNTTDVPHNTTDIQQNTTDMPQNTTDIQQNTTDKPQNTTDIQQITTDIQQNTTDVQQITTAAQQNTTDIQQNTTYKQQTTTNIQPNTTDMQQNTTDIQRNTTDIQPNTTDMQQNTTNIQPNTTDMQQNTTDILPNTTDMQQNTTDIQQNTRDIQQNTTDIQRTTTDIQQNITYTAGPQAIWREWAGIIAGASAGVGLLILAPTVACCLMKCRRKSRNQSSLDEFWMTHNDHRDVKPLSLKPELGSNLLYPSHAHVLQIGVPISAFREDTSVSGHHHTYKSQHTNCPVDTKGETLTTGSWGGVQLHNYRSNVGMRYGSATGSRPYTRQRGDNKDRYELTRGPIEQEFDRKYGSPENSYENIDYNRQSQVLETPGNIDDVNAKLFKNSGFSFLDRNQI